MTIENQQIYDDVDYRAMQDFTRYGNLGMLPAELAARDMAAHESICDYILDGPSVHNTV